MYYDYLPLLGLGAFYTIVIALLSFFIASLIGLLMALFMASKSFILVGFSKFYASIARGIPEIVMLLIVYFGLQSMLSKIALKFPSFYIEVSPFIAGFLSIGITFGGYMCETFYEAYHGVSSKQKDAAISLGFSRISTFTFILLPQIFRCLLPGLSNIFQNILKATAIVSVINVESLARSADIAGKATGMQFFFMSFAMCLFLFITALFESFFSFLIKSYSKGT